MTPVWPQDAREFPVDRLRILQVFEHATRHDHIDAGVWQWDLREVGVVCLNTGWHICERDQLDADQSLRFAQIGAQHRGGSSAAGVKQRRCRAQVPGYAALKRCGRDVRCCRSIVGAVFRLMSTWCPCA